MVKRGHKEHEPSSVNIFRDDGGVINGKALITHAEDEIKGTPSVSPVLFQHGDAIEEMAGVDHQRHGKCLERIKCPEQQVYCYKFYASGKDRNTHEHRINKGKAGYIHIDPVCQPQEPETCEDGDCMGKSRPEGTADLSVPADLYMLFCHK